MDYRTPQKLQSTTLSDYKIRICVNGTRKWSDRKKFHQELISYLEQFPDDTPILFISGKAWSGADDFIIRWCRKFGYPCKEMPADWDNHPGSAGYIRNEEMASVMTHLLSYWDGVSNGTKHMIDCAVDRQLPVKIINITL